MLSVVTLDKRWNDVGGRPSGFDYMRLTLATLVVLTHTVIIGEGRPAHAAIWEQPGVRSLHAMILPAFFALSGFLVAGSLERCRTLISFIGLRALRIAPALVVETVLSAFLLGALFTTLPLKEYVTSREFFSYMLNMVGDVHYRLPGVFARNPYPNFVNGQLWTLPAELRCYLVLAILAGASIVYRPKLLLPLVLVATALTPYYVSNVLRADRMMTVSPEVLILAFLYGVILFLNRKRAPWSAGVGVLAFAAAFICLAIPDMDAFAALPIAYVTVCIGLLNPPRRFLFAADYSYGIFLYGYPIQQAVVAALGPMPWWENMALAFPIIVVFAGLSWHFVEKPALRLRKTMIELEDTAIEVVKTVPFGRFLLPYVGAPAKAA